VLASRAKKTKINWEQKGFSSPTLSRRRGEMFKKWKLTTRSSLLKFTRRLSVSVARFNAVYLNSGAGGIRISNTGIHLPVFTVFSVTALRYAFAGRYIPKYRLSPINITKRGQATKIHCTGVTTYISPRKNFSSYILLGGGKVYHTTEVKKLSLISLF